MSKLANKNAFFFPNLLNNAKSFVRNDECERAFQKLKEYLATPLILTRFKPKEMMHLYLVATNSVDSRIIMQL